MSTDSERTWIVSQIGAREHYAVARAFAFVGALRTLYTDIWCPSWARSLFRTAPDPIRSMANRHHSDLPESRVSSFPLQAIRHALARRFSSTYQGDDGYYRYHLDVGAQYASSVRDHLKNQSLPWDQTGFFGYSTGSLETLEWLSSTDCHTVIDQISPGRFERELVLEESRRWPGWATKLPVLHSEFHERLEQEWALADVVLVNSDWSKQALTKQGVPSSKIVVVPLAYEPPAGLSVLDPVLRSHSKPFRLLWLGSVNLRKGIPYLLKAAERLVDRPIDVRVVGPLQISQKAQDQAPDNVTFIGRVPRDQASIEYQAADAFVLPTLSDGFAITQLEAMAHGVPVITTPNCGRVVTDGDDGFIVPVRDADALAGAIAALADDPERTAEMSVAARKTSQTFTIDRLAKRLIGCLNTTSAPSPPSLP